MEESLEQSLSSIGEDAARATCPSCMSLSSTRGRGLKGRDRGRERLVYFILLLFFLGKGVCRATARQGTAALCGTGTTLRGCRRAVPCPGARQHARPPAARERRRRQLAGEAGTGGDGGDRVRREREARRRAGGELLNRFFFLFEFWLQIFLTNFFHKLFVV